MAGNRMREVDYRRQQRPKPGLEPWAAAKDKASVYGTPALPTWLMGAPTVQLINLLTNRPTYNVINYLIS